MPVTLVTVSFPTVSGLNEDRIVNTFNFAIEAAGTPNGTAAITAAEIVPELLTFYDDLAPGQVATISSYLSSSVQRNADVEVKLQSRPASGDLGPPEEIGSFQLTEAPVSSVNLPAECCVVLSQNAAAPGTIPGARRRGRIYIGPLNTSAVTAGDDTVRVTLGCVEDIALAAVDFKARVAALRSAPNRTLWSVFSTMDNVGRAVQVGFVDNAIDTQRRRGEVATFRENWGP